MARTFDTIQKLPDECVRTVNLYANLMQREKELGRPYEVESASKKLRGYLTCLRDLGLFTQTDLMNLYLWVISGHTVDKVGKPLRDVTVIF